MSDREQDPYLGWVSITEIRNVFSEAIRALDKHVWPDRTTGSRDHVMKHIETIQYELYKRCKRSYSDFLQSGGVVLRKKDEGQQPEVSNRDLHEKRLNELRGRR